MRKAILCEDEPGADIKTIPKQNAKQKSFTTKMIIGTILTLVNTSKTKLIAVVQCAAVKHAIAVPQRIITVYTTGNLVTKGKLIH